MQMVRARWRALWVFLYKQPVYIRITPKRLHSIYYNVTTKKVRDIYVCHSYENHIAIDDHLYILHKYRT